jgi:hypothetical protein
MTMHLAHPSLSLGGKKKGKIKFRNADEARKARELEESWNALQKNWGIKADEKRRRRALSAEPWQPTREVYRGDTSHLKSVGQASGVAVLAPAKVYTGTKVKGIATMHKSNAVPVFSDEEAIDISRMRR